MLWVLMALGAVQASSAPEPAAAGSDDIVVTGKLHRDVERQVRAVSRNIENRPFARFQMPVCVASIGLSSPIGVQIVERMMEDARALGVPASPDDTPCEPNVILVFLDNGRDELQRMARTNYKWFAQLTLDDLRDLRRQQGPVQVIRTTAYRQDDGSMIDAHPIRQPSPQTQAIPGAPVDPISDALGKGVMIVQRRAESARISPGFRQETQLSLLVFDRSALMGKTTRQIADYAAMRAFADAVPDPHAGVNTILSLFDANKAHAPAELTAFDRGYLRGAYATAANAYPDVQEAAISRSINREMILKP